MKTNVPVKMVVSMVLKDDVELGRNPNLIKGRGVLSGARKDFYFRNVLEIKEGSGVSSRARNVLESFFILYFIVLYCIILYFLQ